MRVINGFHDVAAVARMPYREFGQAKSRVISALSVGGSAIGGVFSPIRDLAAAHDTVRASLQAGVNLIDTAPWYGHGESERQLGLALRGVPREAFFLHTKVGRYEASVTRMFDFTYERTVASVEESLQRLGLDYVDTIQVHDPEFAPSIDTVLQETLPALAEAQRRGWVRSIGITGYPLPVLLELAERSPVPIASALTYCHCTLASDELVASGTLAALAAQGIAVLNGSPLGMGLLTQGGPQPWHPASAELKRRAAAAAQWCTSRGFAIERLAMGHCLETAARSPGITSTISATIDPDEMRANIALATGEKPLSHEERQALASVRALFFGNDLPAQDRSWEGVEVTKYWVKLGKAREGERYAAAAASRAAGLSIPAAHERLA